MLVVVLVSAGLDDVDPKENVVAAGLDDAVVLAADASKLKLGVMEGPVGFWAPPKIGTLDGAADAPVEKPVGLDSAVGATVDVLEGAAAAAAGFGDPKANIPLPTIEDGLLSVLFVVAADAKLKDGLAGEDPNVLELAVVVAAPAAASEPKLTVGFFCSVLVSLLMLLLATGLATGDAVVEMAFGVSTGFPNEKPTVLGASAGLLLEGEPKLNPLVVVVEVTASDVLEASDRAGLDPKLNPPVDACLGGSVFSVGLGLSVASEAPVCLTPKLKPLALAGADALTALAPLPKLNLGLSSELVVFVVDVTEPKVNPVLAGVDALPLELAGGMPKENPALGASLAASELGGTPKLNLAPEEDDAGLLPKEKEGAFSGVEPGFACSQQAHFERDASFRVIQALHSHLLVDCCATSALNP